MRMKIDVYHAENAQAELEKIAALVNMLQEFTEECSKEAGTYQQEFNLLNLNLMNVYDLLYQLRADLTKVIDAAYHAGG